MLNADNSLEKDREMNEKVKILDDFIDQIPALRKACIDSVEENDRLSQANLKIQLKLDCQVLTLQTKQMQSKRSWYKKLSSTTNGL